MTTPSELTLPTHGGRRLDPALKQLLGELQPGDRVKITQTVRVGTKSWPAVTAGVFRAVNYLATGLSTERVKEDDIVVPLVHFTKDNGELSSISIDENTKLERDAAK